MISEVAIPCIFTSFLPHECAALGEKTHYGSLTIHGKAMADWQHPLGDRLSNYFVMQLLHHSSLKSGFRITYFHLFHKSHYMAFDRVAYWPSDVIKGFKANDTFH